MADLGLDLKTVTGMLDDAGVNLASGGTTSPDAGSSKPKKPSRKQPAAKPATTTTKGGTGMAAPDVTTALANITDLLAGLADKVSGLEKKVDKVKSSGNPDDEKQRTLDRLEALREGVVVAFEEKEKLEKKRRKQEDQEFADRVMGDITGFRIESDGKGKKAAKRVVRVTADGSDAPTAEARVVTAKEASALDEIEAERKKNKKLEKKVEKLEGKTKGGTKKKGKKAPPSRFGSFGWRR